MDVTHRRELARRALDGYVSGPAASTEATARALAKVDNAVSVVLVEGISDQIALETAAVGRGRDLEVERVVIVPIGGAHAVDRFLTTFGPLGSGMRLAGLCDRARRRYSGADWSRRMSARPARVPTWSDSGSTSASTIWRRS